MSDTPSEKKAKTITLRKEMQKVMEKTLRPISRKKLLDAAQELVYDAWEAPSQKQAVELAQRALELSVDCSDAYCILAERHAKTDEEAISLYRQGIEAGRRALGKKAFREDVGHFWGLLETRPFMRAMDGLAAILRGTEGSECEAVEIWREMICLNPGDNQGVRYRLLSLLVELGRDVEAGELLDLYGDDFMADWAYARALLAFRREGDTDNARFLLGKALERNRHVPKFLLGKKKVPRTLDDYVTPGEESEAVSCCVGFLVAWFGTPGALEWLSVRAGIPIGPKPRRPSLFPAQEKKNLMELLKQVADPDSALTLEELHGLLFGLAITPEAVNSQPMAPPYFRGADGVVPGRRGSVHSSRETLWLFNRLVGEQQEGSLSFPAALTKSSAAAYLQDWCYGLFLALTLRPQVWGIEDDDVGNALARGEGTAFAAAVVTVIGLPEMMDDIDSDSGNDALSESDKIDFYLSMRELLPDAVATLCREGRNYEARRRRESLHVVPHAPRSVEKIGRNDPCPCGSGKKYKKCCG